MKNIVFLSYNDNYGAGSAVYMFHKLLQEKGFNSKMLVLHKTREDDSVIKIYESRLKQKVYKLMDIIEDKIGLFDKNYQFYDRMRYAINSASTIEEKLEFEPDIIILGWISKFINLELILELSQKYSSKVYWMFTDMAPMTGGCHYKWSCIGYQQDCNNCPAVRYPYEKLPILNLEKKKSILSKIDIGILYLAPWFKEVVDKSPIFCGSKKLFINTSAILDEDIFIPLDKYKLRNKYKIPLDKKVILYSAVNINEQRKGYSYFIEAIKYYINLHANNNLCIVTIGDNSIDFNSHGIFNIEYIHFGIIKDFSILSEVINVADISISPVIEDMGPAMLIFYMLCGVPPIVFDVAIAKDVVQHKQSGYVAHMEDAVDIVNGIDYLLNLKSNEYEEMCFQCRNSVLTVYSKEIEDKHLKLFIEDLNND